MTQDIERSPGLRVAENFVTVQAIELGLGFASLAYAFVERVSGGNPTRMVGATTLGIVMFADSIRRTTALRADLQAVD